LKKLWELGAKNLSGKPPKAKITMQQGLEMLLIHPKEIKVRELLTKIISKKPGNSLHLIKDIQFLGHYRLKRKTFQLLNALNLLNRK